MQVEEASITCSHFLPYRKMEARSFYTYFLRRLRGVTRGPYAPTSAPDAPIKSTLTPRRPADR